jgi:histidine ammonia-lyase
VQSSVRHTARGHGPSRTSHLLGQSSSLAALSARETPPAAVSGGRTPGVVSLDGHSLTIEQVMQIARGGSSASIDNPAMRRVQRSYDLLLEASDQGIPIYGLNRGVGLNKDKTLFTGPAQDPAARQASERWNANNLRATSAGVGDPIPDVLDRATMVIRLNSMLVGDTGAQPKVVEMYRDFLNDGINPVVPSRGSLGEADITILAQFGLAMMGEGTVRYNGVQMPAADALRAAGIEQLVPFGKDSLAIMSSNAFGAAEAALAATDAGNLLAVYPRVFALSLEGLNGNIAPFLPAEEAIHPFGARQPIDAAILDWLNGSYLLQPSDQRALQDPLSFRSAGYVFGAAILALEELREQLSTQINSSDDNPAVIPGIMPRPEASPQELTYYTTSGTIQGAVIPTANFEPLPWVASLEKLNIVLSHVSRASAERMNRLGDPDFTHLQRFLAPDPVTLAYSAIQKVYATLDGENQNLANPVSAEGLPVAGDIEDASTFSASIARSTAQIVDNLYSIAGIELMHAAQAIDLRRRAEPALALGTGTLELYSEFRKHVTFLDKDRELTPDITASRNFLIGLGY